MRLRQRRICDLWAFALVTMLSSGASGAEFSKAVEPEVLAQRTYDRRFSVDSLRKIAEVADGAGVDLFLIGGAASGLLNRLRIAAPDAQLKLDHLINPASSDLDAAIRHKDGRPTTHTDVEEVRLALSRAVPYLAFDLQSLDGSGSAPGFTEPRYLQTHHDSTDFLAVHLNARSAKGVVRDARDWRGEHGLPQALKDLASGSIRFFPEAKSSTQGKWPRQRPRGEMRAVLRMLTKSLRYGLALDQKAEAFARQAIHRFEPTSMDKHLRAWLNSNGKKLFDPQNLNGDTLAFLERFPGLVPKLAETGLRSVVGPIDRGRKPAGGWRVGARPSIREMIDTILDIDALTNVRRLVSDAQTPRRRALYIKELEQAQLGTGDLEYFDRVARRRLAEINPHNATLTLAAIFASERLYGGFPELARDAVARIATIDQKLLKLPPALQLRARGGALKQLRPTTKHFHRQGGGATN